MLDQFFSGSALCVLDTVGRMILPAFVRATLVRRGEDRALLIGAHEVDPCLIAYDRSVVPLLFADLERRRIAEEPVAPGGHYRRSRRAFGFVEETDVLGDRSPEQWQQDAFGQVDAWLRALGLRDAAA